MTFTMHSMQEILSILQNEFKTKSIFSFNVLNPDFSDAYAGENICIDKLRYIHRGYKSWTDLAEILKCSMLTPKENAYPLVSLVFKKLKIQDSFHLDTQLTKEEKYGTNSPFAHIHKMEEPAFLYYYLQALENVNIAKKTCILNLGVNRADEFLVIKNKLGMQEYKKIKFIGIDHSPSAISFAQKSFKEKNITFYVHDIQKIDTLSLGKFDFTLAYTGFYADSSSDDDQDNIVFTVGTSF